MKEKAWYRGKSQLLVLAIGEAVQGQFLRGFSQKGNAFKF
jgi:hypothetical protein